MPIYGSIDDMLGAMANPMAGFGRMGRAYQDPNLYPSGIPRFDEEEEDRLISRLTQTGLGGLSTVGRFLDKYTGARALRGLLGGEPSEILSILPFSDLAGITSPEKAVGGRQLLENWGVLEQNRPGFDAGDVAGFAAEVLLDPLSWFTFGGSALGRAGQVAKSAGVLGKATKSRYLAPALETGGKLVLERGPRVARMQETLGSILEATPAVERAGLRTTLEAGAERFGGLTPELMGEPLGGLAGFGPFAAFRPHAATKILGTGETAQGIAGGLDVMGDWLRYSPPVRAAAAAMSPTAHGVFSKSGQIERTASFWDEMARQAEAKGRGISQERLLSESQVGEGLTDVERADQRNRALRQLVEAKPFERVRSYQMTPEEFVGRTVGEYDPLDPFSALRGLLRTPKQEAAHLALTEKALRQGKPVTIEAVEGYAREGKLPGLVDEPLVEVARQMRSDAERMNREVYELGGPVSQLEDTINYLHRTKTFLEKPTPGYGRAAERAFAVTDPSQIKREDVLRNIPWSRRAGSFGTTKIQEMASDPALRSGNVEAAAEQVRQRYLGMTPRASQDRIDLVNTANWDRTVDELSEKLQSGKISPEDQIRLGDLQGRLSRLSQRGWIERVAKFDERTGQAIPPRFELTDVGEEHLAALESLWTQGRELATTMQGLDPQFVSRAGEGVRFLGQQPVMDHVVRQLYFARTKSGLEAIHRMFARNAVESVAEVVPPGMMSFKEGLKGAGMTEQAWASAKRTIQERRADLRGLAGEPGDYGFLDRLMVPEQVAGDASRVVKGFTSPQAVGELVKGWDQVLNIFKTSVTSLWPAFHGRNFVSGLWQNWVIGAFRPDAYGDMARLLKGESLDEGSLRAIPWLRSQAWDLTKETDRVAASRRLAEMMHAQRLTGPGSNIYREVLGVEGESLGRGMLQHVPGERPQTMWGTLKGALPGQRGREGQLLNWNPLEVAGGGMPWMRDQLPEVDRFWIAAMGRDVGNLTELTNRGSGWLALLKKGWDPEAAARQVRAAQVDYSMLSPLERSVGRRLIPFYSWTRQMMPFTLEQLIERPGGAVGTALRTTSNLRQEQGYLPEYLSEGLAIPWPFGEQAPGKKKYLTRFDLPYETGIELLNVGPKGVQRTLGNVFGQFRPELKGLAEMAGGTQFYSGRRLEELYGPTGNVLADQLIMNSPLARAYTSGRTALDPRKNLLEKAMNLLSGLKVSDVDVGLQRDVATGELVRDMLRGEEGIGAFETMYVKPGAQLTPEQKMLLGLQYGLARRAKERKKAALNR